MAPALVPVRLWLGVSLYARSPRGAQPDNAEKVIEELLQKAKAEPDSPAQGL